MTSLRGPAVASRVGRVLGIAIIVCFVTGLLSHWMQNPPGWFWWPTRPVWLYQLTQGAHVITGIAEHPAAPRQAVVGVPELVAATADSVAVARRRTRQHRSVGGRDDLRGRDGHSQCGAVVSVGVLLPADPLRRRVGRRWRASRAHRREAAAHPVGACGSARRIPVGEQFSGRPGSRLGSLRLPWPDSRFQRCDRCRCWHRGAETAHKDCRSTGRQSQPGSRSRRRTGITGSRSPDQRTSAEFTRTQMQLMAQTKATLPIACVEGWTSSADWEGVPLRSLLDQVGAPRGRDVRVTSLERSGLYRATTVPANFADDPLTLVALRVNGKVLDLDHGYPCRLIAPARPGVLQTKWLARIEVL